MGDCEKRMNILKNKKLFLLDMDGTIYLDNELFDGNKEFLKYMKVTKSEKTLIPFLKFASIQLHNLMKTIKIFSILTMILLS